MRDQADFDNMIGRLDRILSEMVDCGRIVKSKGEVTNANIEQWGEVDVSLDPINTQTLKHHAEDMILAGHKILRDIGHEDEPVIEIRVSREKYVRMDNEALIREMRHRALAYPPVSKEDLDALYKRNREEVG